MRARIETRDGQHWGWLDLNPAQEKEARERTCPFPADGAFQHHGTPGEYGAQGWTGLIVAEVENQEEETITDLVAQAEEEMDKIYAYLDKAKAHVDDMSEEERNYRQEAIVRLREYAKSSNQSIRIYAREVLSDLGM